MMTSRTMNGNVCADNSTRQSMNAAHNAPYLKYVLIRKSGIVMRSLDVNLPVLYLSLLGSVNMLNYYRHTYKFVDI